MATLSPATLLDLGDEELKSKVGNSLTKLATLLDRAHKTAVRGCKIRSGGATYGNASIHFAALLHEAWKEEPMQTEMKAVVGAMAQVKAENSCEWFKKLLRIDNRLAWGPYFSGSTGVPDLANILAGLCFGATGLEERSEYARALQRMQSFFLLVNYRWVVNNDFREFENEERLSKAVEKVGEELCFLTFEGSEQINDDEAVPTPIRNNIKVMMNHILPTPSTVLAIAGPEAGHSYEIASKTLKPLVEAAHKLLEENLQQLKDTNEVKEFWLNVHLRYFLWNVAPQLSLTMVRCDRIPALGPWYALIILAVRAYAMTAAGLLIGDAFSPRVKDEASATYWLLRILALPGSSTLRMMPSALESLLSPQTRSSYEPLKTQDAAYWVLLRASLSGLDTQQAIAVGTHIFDTHKKNKPVIARFGVLCLLMRTQAAMVVLLMETSGTDSCLPADSVSQKSEMFNLLTYVTMPASTTGAGEGVSDQSVFEMITTFIAGSSDLEFFATDRAMFLDLETIGAAWNAEVKLRVGEEEKERQKISLVQTKDSDLVVDNLHIRLVKEFRSVSEKWIKAIKSLLGMGPLSPESMVDCLQELGVQMRTGGFGMVFEDENGATNTPSEIAHRVMERLDRVAAAHARCHNDAWLQMAFEIAVDLEDVRFHQHEKEFGESFQKEHRICLIRPPKAVAEKGLAVFRADATWLRLYFRRETERVLHWSRHQGMWKSGNHRILVAWFSTPQGPRLFARAITLHTTENVELSKDVTQDRDAGWLMNDSLIGDIRVRGEDSVVCAALEFSQEVQKHLEQSVRGELQQKKKLIKEYESLKKGIVSEEQMQAAAAAEAFLKAQGATLKPKDEAQKEKEDETVEAMLQEGYEEACKMNEEPMVFDEFPCVLDSHRARRMLAGMIHGASRWRHPRMDRATELAMTLFTRIMDGVNEIDHDKVLVCQNTFKHGCSVAMVSFPPVEQDMQAEPIQQKIRDLPMDAVRAADQAALAQSEFHAKPKFREPSAKLKQELADEGVLV